MQYEIPDEQPTMLAEPMCAYGNAAYRLQDRDEQPTMTVVCRSPEYEARYNKMRDFCRAHFNDDVYNNLEAHGFWIDCPPPQNEETEEEMWANIEKELGNPDEYFVPWEEVLKDFAAWHEWKD